MFMRHIHYYYGSAEGQEYPDLQVWDEVTPRLFFVSYKSLYHSSLSDKASWYQVTEVGNGTLH